MVVEIDQEKTRGGTEAEGGEEGCPGAVVVVLHDVMKCVCVGWVGRGMYME